MKYVRFLMVFATLIFSSRIFAFQFTFFDGLPSCPDKTQSCPAKTQTKVPDPYEYSPSWMADIRKGYERVWWCGFKEGPIHPRLHAEQTIGGIRNFYGRDVIWYWDGTLTGPRVVLEPTEYWEGRYVCDPAVIYGVFSPPGMKKTYSMAMYYTATNGGMNTTETDTELRGVNNKIGVAFSNDGIHWDKYPGNPIILPAHPASPAAKRYGAGQPQARNTNGRSHVTLWYTDTTIVAGKNRVAELFADDGVHFSKDKINAVAKADKEDLLSVAGFLRGQEIASAGIALSPSAPWYLYLVFGDKSSKELSMYRIPYENRFTGRWEFIDRVRADDVGSQDIFEAGFRTGIYGNLFGYSWPTIFIGFGCGQYDNPRDTTTWDLCQAGGN